MYDYNGKLKRQLTSGEWRSDAIVAVDSIKQIAWIRGEGKEPGENLYNQHLYKVNLIDGTTTLMDAGNANHNSSVSKNQKWIVDQFSRVDTVPRVALRDGLTGRTVMDLETADLTKLKEAGWRYAAQPAAAISMTSGRRITSSMAGTSPATSTVATPTAISGTSPAPTT